MNGIDAGARLVMTDMLSARLHPDVIDPAAVCSQRCFERNSTPPSPRAVHFSASDATAAVSRVRHGQGNALLALIVAQPQHWQSLATSLVEAQPTAEARERASSAFSALLATNGVAANLSRPNRQRFRNNLETLLQSTRGLVLPMGA